MAQQKNAQRLQDLQKNALNNKLLAPSLNQKTFFLGLLFPLSKQRKLSLIFTIHSFKNYSLWNFEILQAI